MIFRSRRRVRVSTVGAQRRRLRWRHYQHDTHTRRKWVSVTWHVTHQYGRRHSRTRPTSDGRRTQRNCSPSSFFFPALPRERFIILLCFSRVTIGRFIRAWTAVCEALLAGWRGIDVGNKILKMLTCPRKSMAALATFIYSDHRWSAFVSSKSSLGSEWSHSWHFRI